MKMILYLRLSEVMVVIYYCCKEFIVLFFILCKLKFKDVKKRIFIIYWGKIIILYVIKSNFVILNVI